MGGEVFPRCFLIFVAHGTMEANPIILLHDLAQLIMVAPPTHLDTTFCVEEC